MVTLGRAGGETKGFGVKVTMNDEMDKYGHYLIKGTYLNEMLHCGRFFNSCVQNALEYLPLNIFDQIKTSVAIYSTNETDGCRLAREICKSREIILISERIFPGIGSTEGDERYRYFIFVVLHEIAHAYLKHRSPMFDSLSVEENDAQESEADSLALQWFNNHVVTTENPHLKALAKEEIDRAKSASAKERKAIYQKKDRRL